MNKISCPTSSHPTSGFYLRRIAQPRYSRGQRDALKVINQAWRELRNKLYWPTIHPHLAEILSKMSASRAIYLADTVQIVYPPLNETQRGLLSPNLVLMNVIFPQCVYWKTPAPLPTNTLYVPLPLECHLFISVTAFLIDSFHYKSTRRMLYYFLNMVRT